MNRGLLKRVPRYFSHPLLRTSTTRTLFASLLIVLAGCRETPVTSAHGKPVSHWVGALRDSDARVRKRAVAALGNVGPADKAAIPALIEAVKDRDATVRGEAILALLKLGPAAKDAIPVLTQAQRDRDAQVRSYATKALEKIGGSP
jgi:HEAT repeat protein